MDHNEFYGMGYLIDKNNNFIEKELILKYNKEYISLSDGDITMMVKNEEFIKNVIDEELIPDLDNRKIYLELLDLKSGKTFKKYFKTEFEKDKFKRKLKFSSKLKVVSDSIGATLPFSSAIDSNTLQEVVPTPITLCPVSFALFILSQSSFFI